MGEGAVMVTLNQVDSSWLPIIKKALKVLPSDYFSTINQSPFLPEENKIFNAFSLPLEKVQYVLFGETPYPRAQSANGYAFWDAAVKEIWSENGLSKPVNRATSLRNFIKMLLVTESLLKPDNLTQEAISKIDKTHLVQTLPEFFNQMMDRGFLLLNASLILREGKKNQDAKIWLPFMEIILKELYLKRPQVKLILFGQIAKAIDQLPAAKPYKKLISEHPYNYSFIVNKEVQNFFRPLCLLRSLNSCFQ